MGRILPNSVLATRWPGYPPGVVQIFFHAAVAREIGVDKLGRFALLDIQLLGQTKGREAVDNSEIDDFGGAAVSADCAIGPTPNTSCAVRA